MRGATGTAAHLDDVIDPAHDWRNTNMGQALIAYSKPYDQTSDPTPVDTHSTVTSPTDTHSTVTSDSVHSDAVEKPLRHAHSLRNTHTAVTSDSVYSDAVVTTGDSHTTVTTDAVHSDAVVTPPVDTHSSVNLGVVSGPVSIDSHPSHNYRDGRVNPFAYSWQGQCTWYVYGRMLETGLLPAGAKANGWFPGNAWQWKGDATRAGLPVTSTPTPGARGIVVWPPNTQGTLQWGHVAFLEEVYPDGRIRISEANWPTGNGIRERILTPAEYQGLSFVRLENATPKPTEYAPPAQPGKQRQYVVRPGDTLWAIALRELGDGNRWKEITKADGSKFTEAEARNLQVGMSVYLPVSYHREPDQPVTSPPVNKPTPSQLKVNAVSDEGLKFIARHEGTNLNLYNDPAGHCTIGIGHLVHLGSCNGAASEAEFRGGITETRALALLRADVSKAVQAVNNLVKVPLSQNQFDALVSFAFNVGTGEKGFAGSDLLAKLNAGQYDAVPDELNRWVHGSGVVLPGLVTRRKDEGILFKDGKY